MDNPLSIFMTSFALGFTGAVVPGPLLAVVVTGTGRRGFWAGPISVAGHGLMELTVALVLAAGLVPFANSNSLLATVSLAGAVGLFFFGFKLTRDVGKLNPQTTEASGVSLGPMAGGIVATVSNPYWTLWWLTIGLELVLLSVRMGRTGFASFYVGHVLSDLVWYTLVSGGIVFGRQVLKESHFRLLLFLCAFSMFGFSAYFGLNGIRLLSL